VAPDQLANRAGEIVSAGLGANQANYQVITSIYANDLATDVNQLRGTSTVSIGLILQSAAGDAAIAIRGTVGIYEWLHDAMFLTVHCPFLPSAGSTEDGFTAMYLSMTTGAAGGSPSVVKALADLPWTTPVRSLTICGHSLGGALATLLALDVGANTTTPAFKSPTVYMYASPRTGDPSFAGVYNHVVPQTFRIANRVDLVPKLPLPPLYEHVHTLYDLNPIVLFPPQVLVKFDIPCEHFLTSYLHPLSLEAGGVSLPLDSACVPSATIVLPSIH
jgi:pimeloyl-ACP methyl ester carboxylesterase